MTRCPPHHWIVGTADERGVYAAACRDCPATRTLDNRPTPGYLSRTGQRPKPRETVTR